MFDIYNDDINFIFMFICICVCVLLILIIMILIYTYAKHCLLLMCINYNNDDICFICMLNKKCYN